MFRVSFQCLGSLLKFGSRLRNKLFTRVEMLESSGYSVLDKGSQRYVLAEWHNPV